jgi:hypothetical protein
LGKWLIPKWQKDDPEDYWGQISRKQKSTKMAQREKKISTL